MKKRQIIYLILLMVATSLIFDDAGLAGIALAALSAGIVFGITTAFNSWKYAVQDFEKKYLESERSHDATYNEMMVNKETVRLYENAMLNIPPTDYDKLPPRVVDTANQILSLIASRIEAQREVQDLSTQTDILKIENKQLTNRLSMLEQERDASLGSMWKVDLIDNALAHVIQNTEKYTTVETAKDYLFDSGRFSKFYQQLAQKSISNVSGGKARHQIPTAANESEDIY